MARNTKPKTTAVKSIAEIMDEVLKRSQSEILSKTGHRNIVDILTFADDFIHQDFSEHPYMKLVLKLFYYKTIGNENLEITQEDIDLLKQICNYNHNVASDYLKKVIVEEEESDAAPEEINQNIIERLSKEWGGNYWLGEKINILKDENLPRNPFDYLVLVLGRRSGKTHISALIASYEVYKLLSIITCRKCKEAYNMRSGEPCPVCGETLMNHPQSYYKIKGMEPLRILLAATKLEQAKDPMLKYVLDNITDCSFFDGKWTHIEGDGMLFFKTEADEYFNEKLSKAGQADYKGSVIIKAVGANSKGSHGLGAVLAIFDEFALFNTEGSNTDAAILEALVPASSLYRERRGDGRIILISAPDLPEGKFFEHYNQGIDVESYYNKKQQEEKYLKLLEEEPDTDMEYDDIVKEDYFDQHLVFQMPTWEYNRLYTIRSLVRKYGAEFGGDPASIKFKKVYGGQFVSAGSDIFIPHKLIDEAIDYSLKIDDGNFMPDLTNSYFMHIDRAGTGSANYACMVGHWQYNDRTKSKVFYEDTSFYWTYSSAGTGIYQGSDGNMYDIDGLNSKLVEIAKKYRVHLLTYDLMQSEESKLKFARAGLSLKHINFSGLNGGNIYGLLFQLFQEGKIRLCSDDLLLIDELKNLRRIDDEKKRGLKVSISKNGKVKTKDLADCLAGAIFASYGSPVGRTMGRQSGGFVLPQSSGNSIFSNGVQNFGYGNNRFNGRN